MKSLLLLFVCFIMLGYAADWAPASIPASEVHRDILPAFQYFEAECVYTGNTTTPPWQIYGRDAPWSTDVQVPDLYSRDDQLLSMAEGPDGKIYVAYDAISNPDPLRYGTGIAWSVDNGLSWNNMVYYSGTYSVCYNEIAVTDDGKIWIWGSLSGGTYTNVPVFMRSRIGYYNRPDTLYGWGGFTSLPNLVYPEVVTWGNGNQLVMTQYIDTGNLQIFCLYSHDSTNYYGMSFAPGGGDPENASISLDVVGTDTILNHGIEYFDGAGSDFDVICYLDTLNGSGGLYGWYTTNPNDDRYPSNFASQGYAYIAYQADMTGYGNHDIMFNCSTDYGETWLGSMIDLTNSGENEEYARLHGTGQTVGCVYVTIDYNQLGFNYSIDNGEVWLSTPEIVDDNSTVNGNYHSAALLHTASFWHAAWEDMRNSGTDGLEIYTSRRIQGQGDIAHSPAELVFNYNTKGFAGPLPEKYVYYHADKPIDVKLEETINRVSPDELIPIFIMLSKQMNSEFLIGRAEKMSKQARRKFVIDECKALANEDQKSLLQYLDQKERQGLVIDILSQWTTNTICLKAKSEIIQEISLRNDVWEIGYSEPAILLDKAPESKVTYKKMDFIPENGREICWGVDKINANDVWSLGYTGDGVVVGHMDSGVNHNHLDLTDHMWDGGSSYPNHGWDFVNDDNDPMDDEGHGTQTAGIVAGDGTRGSNTGVAPDAQIMALKIYPGTNTEMGEAIAFALGQGANLLSCSIGWDDPSNSIKNWCRGQSNTVYAAGIVWCNAAGNGDGYGGHYSLPQDINSPADCPGPYYAPNGGNSASIAVGATDNTDNVASWSSYGPTHWNTGTYTDYPYPPGLMKPDLAAPGVGCKSLDHSTDTLYDNNISGTSFAQPHVAGTVALMLERNPALTPRQIDSLLQTTAIDIESAGRDNLSGAGRIDALLAVNAISQGAKWAELLVINQASATGILEVTSIIKRLDSDWIISISPTQFNVPIDDSRAVWVTVDTTGQGMSWGVITYSDTLYIYSNSIFDDVPERVPVLLTTADLGAEEEFEIITPISSTPMLSVSPNPFKSSMRIECDISYRQPIDLAIYDACGRKVRTLLEHVNKAGSFAVIWDGKDNTGRQVSSGIYFCRLEAENKTQTSSVILVK